MLNHGKEVLRPYPISPRSWRCVVFDISAKVGCRQGGVGGVGAERYVKG